MTGSAHSLAARYANLVSYAVERSHESGAIRPAGEGELDLGTGRAGGEDTKARVRGTADGLFPDAGLAGSRLALEDVVRSPTEERQSHRDRYRCGSEQRFEADQTPPDVRHPPRKRIGQQTYDEPQPPSSIGGDRRSSPSHKGSTAHLPLSNDNDYVAATSSTVSPSFGTTASGTCTRTNSRVSTQ